MSDLDERHHTMALFPIHFLQNKRCHFRSIDDVPKSLETEILNLLLRMQMSWDLSCNQQQNVEPGRQKYIPF